MMSDVAAGIDRIAKWQTKAVSLLPDDPYAVLAKLLLLMKRVVSDAERDKVERCKNSLLSELAMAREKDNIDDLHEIIYGLSETVVMIVDKMATLRQPIIVKRSEATPKPRVVAAAAVKSPVKPAYTIKSVNPVAARLPPSPPSIQPQPALPPQPKPTLPSQPKASSPNSPQINMTPTSRARLRLVAAPSAFHLSLQRKLAIVNQQAAQQPPAASASSTAATATAIVRVMEEKKSVPGTTSETKVEEPPIKMAPNVISVSALRAATLGDPSAKRNCSMLPQPPAEPMSSLRAQVQAEMAAANLLVRKAKLMPDCWVILNEDGVTARTFRCGHCDQMFLSFQVCRKHCQQQHQRSRPTVRYTCFSDLDTEEVTKAHTTRKYTRRKHATKVLTAREKIRKADRQLEEDGLTPPVVEKSVSPTTSKPAVKLPSILMRSRKRGAPSMETADESSGEKKSPEGDASTRQAAKCRPDADAAAAATAADAAALRGKPAEEESISG